MCLPCWPVKDITLEQDSPSGGHEMFQYVWDANRGEWVPTVQDRVSEEVFLGVVFLLVFSPFPFAANPQDHSIRVWGVVVCIPTIALSPTVLRYGPNASHYPRVLPPMFLSFNSSVEWFCGRLISLPAPQTTGVVTLEPFIHSADSVAPC